MDDQHIDVIETLFSYSSEEYVGRKSIIYSLFLSHCFSDTLDEREFIVHANGGYVADEDAWASKLLVELSFNGVLELNESKRKDKYKWVASTPTQKVELDSRIIQALHSKEPLFELSKLVQKEAQVSEKFYDVEHVIQI